MSSNLQALSHVVNDGNSGRYCYELIQRSLHMDHTYNHTFQPLCESTPLQTPERPCHPLKALADIYSSSSNSSTTTDLEKEGCQADTGDDDLMQTTCTSEDVDSMTSMDVTIASNPLDDGKFIVFESCLKKLLSRCMDCGQPITDRDFMYNASNVTVKMTCINSHTTRWDSQPLISHYHAGNLLMSCSSFLTGKVVHLV